MAITRTPIVNDDGSGTLGTVFENAWKTELYNQIDAALATAGAPVLGTFNFTDVSGANLGVLGTAQYCKIGTFVQFQVNIVYPATANGLAALIGYLPWAVHASAPAGCYQTIGAVHQWFMGATQNFVQIKNPTSQAARTNAELSGASIGLVGVYRTV